MYIRSALWYAPFWQVEINGTISVVSNSGMEPMKTGKLSAEDAMDVRQAPLNESLNWLMLPEGTQISAPVINQTQVKLNKLLGPEHSNGLDWDAIEGQLTQSISERGVAFFSNGDGQERAVETYLGMEAMDRFIITETAFRDKLKTIFSGAELDSYLEKLEILSTDVQQQKIEGIVDKSVSFFRKELNEGENLDSSKASANSFDVTEFKQNLLDQVGIRRHDLQELITSNPKKWEASLTIGSSLRNEFSDQLERASEGYTQSNSLNTMSYSEIDGIYKTICEMEKNLNFPVASTLGYISTEEIIGSHLGQAKAKAILAIDRSGMAEQLKEKFLQAVDDKIDNQIDDIFDKRQQLIETKPQSSEIPMVVVPLDRSQILETMNRFAEIASGPVEQFATAYMNQINQVCDQFRSDSAGISDEELEVVFQSVLGELSCSWNDFIDRLNIGDKHFYYVPDRRRSYINLIVE